MKKYALIGNNISYSLSPKIHGLIFEWYKLKNFSYDILDLSENQLETSFALLAKEYSGFNITVPYKNIITKHLTQSKSPIAPINTIVSKNGETVGYNTDIDGFRHHLFEWLGLLSSHHSACQIASMDKYELIPAREKTAKNVENIGYSNVFDNVLIIGAGGAAEAAIYALNGFGLAMSVKARQSDNLDRLKKIYKLSTDCKNISPSLIINATGKNLIEEGLLDDISTKNLAAVYDISYNHDGQKESFLSKGIRYTDGLGMLIYQAIYAAELMYPIEVSGDIEKLYSYIYNELTRGKI